MQNGSVQQFFRRRRMSLYEELIALDDLDVVRTTFDFECPICFEQIEAGMGIQLKECIHPFCKECITRFIESSEDVELRCPFITPLYRCEGVIQQREMKALVRKEVYEKIIKRFMECDDEHLSAECVVQDEQALQCPNCGVAIMKVFGCDAVICTRCKTEICWVTRGPRWGPARKGDTSGGCRCGEDGKKCHPNCTNCQGSENNE
uniref:RING-type domain-containing protein n=1 Tax=Anopheles atroparvus TaxID=41427 RepID=A0A182JMM8_ANOAO